jgi:ABC-2 type transport system permease protein
MLALIKNEVIKLMSRTKTWVVIVGFILFAGLVSFGVYQGEKNSRKYDSVEYRVKNMESSLEYTKSRKDKIPESIKNDQAKIDRYKSSMDEQISSMEESIKKLKETGNKPIDWREVLNTELKDLESQLKQTEDVMSDEGSAQEKQYLVNRITQLKYLKEHDIKPMKGYEFNSINFTNEFMQILGAIFLVVGIGVFVSDMVSGECTPPTLKVLITQPMSRGKVLLSKFIAVTVVGIALIVAIQAIYFVAIGLISGFGNMNYPMAAGSLYEFDLSTISSNGGHPLKLVEGSTYFIPAWEYILRAVGIQVIFIIAATAFAFFASTLFKSSMISMAVSTVAVIVAVVMLQSISALKKYSAYVFTSYGDAGQLINGSIASAFNNPKITMGFALIVLGVWTVVSYLAAHFIFTKKDILI